uniref:Uncharacterized protein n=1 Tax=Anguilla anguilla TaxID=7936 RepID=A0A0E9TB19_ANGAN
MASFNQTYVSVIPIAVSDSAVDSFMKHLSVLCSAIRKSLRISG